MDGLVTTDVVFARVGQRELCLDLYTPAEGDGPFPGVLCLHGGGMVEGNRADMAPTAEYLARQGFVPATATYRLADEARYPAAIHDAKAAVRWLRAHAGDLRVDPERLGVVGASAGGYLAVMLAATAGEPGFDGEEGPAGVSTAVQAAVPLAPGSDLLLRAKLAPEAGTTEMYSRWLGAGPEQDPERWRMASPILHVSPATAPMLLLHATGDPVTPYPVSEALFQRCRVVGAEAELVPIASPEHGFWDFEQWFGETMERTAAFLRERLG